MTVKQRINILVLLVPALIAWSLAAASPASAKEEPPEDALPVGGGLVDDDHIVVETFTLAGDRISTMAYARDGAPIPIPEDFESQGIVAADAVAYASGPATSGPLRQPENREDCAGYGCHHRIAVA